MCCYRNGEKNCTSVSVGRISSLAFLRSRLPGIRALHNSELNFRTFSVVPLVSPGVTTLLHSAGARGRRLSRAESFPCPASHLSAIACNHLKFRNPSRCRGLKKFHPDPCKFLQPIPSRCEHERDVSLILFVDRRR